LVSIELSGIPVLETVLEELQVFGSNILSFSGFDVLSVDLSSSGFLGLSVGGILSGLGSIESTLGRGGGVLSSG
jgi:hypothetical protein